MLPMPSAQRFSRTERFGRSGCGQAPMTLIHCAFYLYAGMTFPGFGAVHTTGYGAFLYRPVQQIFQTAARG